MKRISCHSPFGELEMVIGGDRLEKIQLGRFAPDPTASFSAGGADCLVENEFTAFLYSYFARQAGHFHPEKLNLKSCTNFKLNCFRALRRIASGRTASYADVARMAGSPRGARAVGQALAGNPFPIFIPCHRVIRSDGKMGGYTGGQEWKEALLEHEKRTRQNAPDASIQ